MINGLLIKIIPKKEAFVLFHHGIHQILYFSICSTSNHKLSSPLSPLSNLFQFSLFITQTCTHHFLPHLYITYVPFSDIIFMGCCNYRVQEKNGKRKIHEIEVVEPSEHGEGEMVGVSILKHSPESLFVPFNVRACFRQLNKE